MTRRSRSKACVLRVSVGQTQLFPPKSERGGFASPAPLLIFIDLPQTQSNHN